jgi:hypothetical protein
MTDPLFFRWSFGTAEAEATKKTAVSVSNSTIHRAEAGTLSALFLS